jgi:signal transduction histidine kinase
MESWNIVFRFTNNVFWYNMDSWIITEPIKEAIYWTRHLDVWLEIAAALVCLALTFIGGRRIIRNHIHRYFALFTFVLALWQILNFFHERADTYETSLLFAKPAILSALWLPLLFYIFALRYTFSKNRTFKIISWSTAASFIMMSPFVFISDYYIKGVRYVAGDAKWYSNIGPIFYVQIAFLAVLAIIASGILLTYSIRINSLVEKNRVKYMLVGELGLAITGIIHSIKITKPHLLPNVMPLGIIFFCTIVFLGIFRRRLLDIDFAIKRIVVGVFLLAISYLIFKIVLAGCHLFFNYFHLNPGGFSAEIIALAVALVFFRQYMPRLGEAAFSWLTPYRSRYQKAFSVFISRSLSHFDLNTLCRDLTGCFKNRMQLKNFSFYVKPDSSPDFHVLDCFGIKNGPDKQINLITDMCRNSTEKIWILEDQERRLRTEILDPEESERIKTIAEFMKRAGAQACLPLYFDKELLGLLSLGPKPKGIYDRKDAELLVRVATQTAMALKNIRNQEALKEKESLANMGEMAAGIAHEIKNPLGSVQGAAQYLESRLTDREDKRFASIILEEIQRLNATVVDFLQFARPLSFEAFDQDPNTVLENTLELFSLEKKYRSITVKKNLTGKRREIPVDNNLMKQVFLNIVINACDAMEEQGTLTIESGYIDDLDESWYRIRIHDTGPGIPPENMIKLFKPFFTTKSRGNGLGLSLCNKIVKTHGGRIAVQSEPGDTVFEIFLPC